MTLLIAENMAYNRVMARNQDRQYHLSANRSRKSRLQQLIERDEFESARLELMDLHDCDEAAADAYVDWLIAQHESEFGYENQITEATLAGMGVWA